MKTEWVVSTLGEACEMYQPKTITAKEMTLNGPYPVFGANGVIGRYDQFNHEQAQLLITCRGATCGAVNVSEPKSWITGNSMVVRPKGKNLDLRFLEYLFRGGVDISSAITGAAQPQITRTNLNPIEIRYPLDLDEQQRIVTLLDEAFDGIAAARANAEQNRQNARAIFESHLQSVFTQRGDGWVSTTIGNSCVLKSGTTVPVSIEKTSGDIPYVKVAEMTLPDNQNGITTSIRFLNRNDVKASWLIPAGAVIFPKRGGAILTNKKRLALVDLCADLNIMSVIPAENLNPEFLYFYFLTVDMRKLGTGSSIPQINNYDIAPLEISFPESTRKQAEIAEFIRSLETECRALESVYQRKIAALDDLKKSLLHQAFTGLL